jgi:hypothetical protein
VPLRRDYIYCDVEHCRNVLSPLSLQRYRLQRGQAFQRIYQAWWQTDNPTAAKSAARETALLL